MSYQFTAVQASTYLHAIATGDLTQENMRRFLVDTHQAAVDQSRESILLESRLAGSSLGLNSIYSVIVERSPHGSVFKRIAYVDTNPDQLPERAEFTQMAASRLGVKCQLFHSV